MMNSITQSLDLALKNRNWYSALFIALTLPDICSKIDEPDTNTNKRYPKWFNTYVKSKYTVRRIDIPSFDHIVDKNARLKEIQSFQLAAYPKTKESEKLKTARDQALMVGEIDAFNDFNKAYDKLIKETSPFAKDFVFLSGQDCYALRCAILHEGTDIISEQNAQDTIERFHFRTPKYLPDGSLGGTVHNNLSSKKILQLQIDIFCKDILDSVEEWIKTIPENDPKFGLLKSRLKIYEGNKNEGPALFS